MNHTPRIAVQSEKSVRASEKLKAKIKETERRLEKLDAAMYELEQGVESASYLEGKWKEREATGAPRSVDRTHRNIVSFLDKLQI